MPDKDQKMMFNNEELSLLKNTFAGDDTLLYTIRKVFLQLPLSEAEHGLIKTVVNDNVIRLLKKRMLPEISPEFPLGQIPSVLTTLTNNINSRDVETMAPQFEAKQLEIEYLEQQFKVLKDPSSEQPISLKEMGVLKGKSPQQQFVDMTAYLFLLGYIDPSLMMVKMLAGEKEETLEQTKERLERNSTK